MTEKEILKKYNSLKEKLAKANKALSEFCTSIKDICTHPESHCYKSYTDHDDGYGKWWKSHFTICTICRKTKPEHSNVWN